MEEAMVLTDKLKSLEATLMLIAATDAEGSGNHMIAEFALKIQHGTDEHRVWLLNEAVQYIRKGNIEELKEKPSMASIHEAVTKRSKAGWDAPASEAGLPFQVWCPPELMPLFKAVQRFFQGMIYKLRKNKSKGRWEGADLGKVMELLKAEVAELQKAIEEGNDVEILLEACDIANFAMIAASIAIEGDNHDYS